VSGSQHAHDHDHTEPPDELVLRVKALESLLIDKGLVDPAAIDALIDTYETKVGPRNGAQVVARAWSRLAFKQWLLEDATAAIASMGYTGRQGEHMKVVENTPTVHNLLVCTLCSCYPWPVLGLPPVWYKSAPYRARAVAEPRRVLQEFGTELAADVDIRVWDSTSEMRYLVLPERPVGTDGWSEGAFHFTAGWSLWAHSNPHMPVFSRQSHQPQVSSAVSASTWLHSTISSIYVKSSPYDPPDGP
jgi:nitrile hydratase